MSGRPTWGSAAVTGLAGFASGLLVAALLIAGRSTPQPAEVTTPPTSTVPAVPVTVTASAPPPSTVTSVDTPPPTTTTSRVAVTVTSTPTSLTPTSTSPVAPLTSGWRD
ncbi:hypothetical protein [Amycolatopsis sp. SID8362]|uniref:hypothetical protein n=1 Tax=Amycolatopsis sp. SID8362 TaxID=2690346 RepID=UPI00136C1A65|nr:hypothetical protein [Amycolatopsis sp. SID8362]NBH12247.1 hypothetical protein [Amycolatopsis sp. SID8362]NED48939.1 hypothetical protein [Amycolatopsis sp. SID8362]